MLITIKKTTLLLFDGEYIEILITRNIKLPSFYEIAHILMEHLHKSE